MWEIRTDQSGESVHFLTLCLFYRGDYRRTDMNQHSSRSHAIFIVTVECCAVRKYEFIFRHRSLSVIFFRGAPMERIISEWAS